MGERLPLFPLGTVLYPGMTLPLHIFEPRYREMVGLRIDDDPMFGVVLIRAGNEVGDEPEIHDIGTSASLLGMVRFDDGRYNLALSGSRRFRVQDCDWEAGYLTGTIEWIDDEVPMPVQDEGLGLLRNAVVEAFDAYLEAIEQTVGAQIERSELAGGPLETGYEICSMTPLSNLERQHLLEMPTADALLRSLLAILRRERALLTTTGIGGVVTRAAASRFSTN